MSYGNWNQVLGVFKLWKLSYDDNLVNTHTLRDPTAATFDFTPTAKHVLNLHDHFTPQKVMTGSHKKFGFWSY